MSSPAGVWPLACARSRLQVRLLHIPPQHLGTTLPAAALHERPHRGGYWFPGFFMLRSTAGGLGEKVYTNKLQHTYPHVYSQVPLHLLIRHTCTRAHTYTHTDTQQTVSQSVRQTDRHAGAHARLHPCMLQARIHARKHACHMTILIYTCTFLLIHAPFKPILGSVACATCSPQWAYPVLLCFV